MKTGHLNFDGAKGAGTIQAFRNRSVVGAAFTLIELLTVIAIIAILASLMIAAFRMATPSKIRNRAAAEMASLSTLIESYNSKKGFYPADTNRDLTDPAHNNYLITNIPIMLYYELVGSNPPTAIPGGMPTLINSGDERQVFHRNLKETGNKNSSVSELRGIKFLGIPIKSPDSPDFAFWRYDSSSTNRHHPEGFDLWIEVLVNGQRERVANWKE
jgi:prepilin-type N-terminal cleavage/methylation domain-containing protein